MVAADRVTAARGAEQRHWDGKAIARILDLMRSSIRNLEWRVGAKPAGQMFDQHLRVLWGNILDARRLMLTIQDKLTSNK